MCFAAFKPSRLRCVPRCLSPATSMVFRLDTCRVDNNRPIDHEPLSRYVPINSIWRRIPITAHCWQWCTRLTENHSNYCMRKINENATGLMAIFRFAWTEHPAKMSTKSSEITRVEHCIFRHPSNSVDTVIDTYCCLKPFKVFYFCEVTRLRTCFL